MPVDFLIFNCLQGIKKILFYKQPIENPQQILEIREHFTESECVSFDDFADITSLIDNNQIPVCLVSLEQIRGLEKKIFHTVVDHVRKVKYVSLINPVDLSIIPRLLKSGTKSVLFTDDPTALMIDCIKNTQSYGGYLSPRIVASINKVNQNMLNVQYKITTRQRQVLQELLKGNSDKMIADHLNISYQTLKSYRKLLYKLFKVSSQGELFALMSL